jgi:hypothetical protein
MTLFDADMNPSPPQSNGHAEKSGHILAPIAAFLSVTVIDDLHLADENVNYGTFE